MTTRRTSLSASLVGLALIFAASGISQVTTANFYAIVNDSTGAVIPGATVTMIHESTNATTTKITDERGEASFPFLRIGRYRLTIEASGFRRFQSTGLELVSGQNVRESYALQLGDITETVEVTGSLPQLNTVAAEQRETLTQRQVEELPLANRNFQNLLELGTGISTAGSGGVRMNGLGRSGLKLTVDGTDATGNPESPSSGLYQGDTNYIQTLSIEAIQEVQVTKGVTPAEFGHQLAGNVNLITKSGTNEWHGSLFENFRAEDLNAKERRQATKSPFTFNQFGGSVGGPILRDRAFIFGTYEGYREVAFSTVQGDVPTQKFRDEAIAAQPVYADMLARFKFPNQAFDPDADVGRWIGVGRRFRRDNHFVLKGDVRVGDSGNLAVTWVRARPYFLNPEDEFIGNGRESRGENDRLTLTYLTGGPAWTSETRFGRNWTNVEREDLFFSQGIEEETFGGRRLPHMGVDGLFSGGGSEIFIIFGPTYSFEQKVAITSGEHSIKFGGIWSSRRVGHNNVENVQFAYASKEDFFANIPRRVQATFGVNRFNSSPNDWGLFAQDDWRVTPNLVINLGVRYDYFDNFVPFPANPGETVGLYNRALLDSQFNLGPIRDPENPYEPDGGVNIGPRVGFSYNLGGRSETVVRGGFSVMFSPMPLDDPAETAANSPQVPFRVRFGREDAIDLGLTFPDYNDDLRKVIEAEAVERIGDFFDPQIQAPYSMNLYLGVQRSLTPTLMIESAFVGNRGVKYRLPREANLPDRVTGLRRNPDIGSATYFCSCQNTVYYSWQTSMRKRTSHNIAFDLHYTWGKALSYAGGDTGGNAPLDSYNDIPDFFDVRSFRGPSTGDITHNVTGDFILDLPSLSGMSSAFVRQALGGWQFTGIIQATTGQPVLVTQSGAYLTMAEYVGGEAVNPNSQRDGQYLNKDAFVLLPLGAGGDPIRNGTLGNGAIRGPGRLNFDFGLGKNFLVGERVGFQLRVEAFNVFNHTPWSSFRTNINNSRFGEFTNFRAARQVQVGARLTF